LKLGGSGDEYRQDPQSAISISSSNALSAAEQPDSTLAAGTQRPANFEFRVSSFGSPGRFPLRKVYDLTLKCSHLFNILDARGAISVTERVALIARVRKLACSVAGIYVERLTAQEVTA